MALTELQRAVLRVLASNRTETSYMAGGAVLNLDWPRMSDDFDIFHDTDEEIGAAADRDITSVREAGFAVAVDIRIYGLVEATVSRHGSSTILQWMSESRRRFLPLVRDEQWGARLHQADLAVNKVLASASRSKARDFVDLVAIETYYCKLAPLVLAASGKPPHMSPVRILEEIARRMNGIPSEELLAVLNLPIDWTPEFIRQSVLAAVDVAATGLGLAADIAVGRLAMDGSGVPRLFETSSSNPGLMLRRATDEPDLVPEFKDGPSAFLH
jgi:hypothetical protein